LHEVRNSLIFFFESSAKFSILGAAFVQALRGQPQPSSNHVRQAKMGDRTNNRRKKSSYAEVEDPGAGMRSLELNLSDPSLLGCASSCSRVWPSLPFCERGWR